MTGPEVPEWVHPGANVFVLQHDMGHSKVLAGVIKNVGKKFVTMEDGGYRFSLKTLSHRSGDWGPSHYLRPLDDPECLIVQRRQRVRRLLGAAEQSIHSALNDKDDGRVEEYARQALSRVQRALDINQERKAP